MTIVAKQSLKYGGAYYLVGDALPKLAPSVQATMLELGQVEDVVSEADAQAVRAMKAKIASLRGEAQADLDRAAALKEQAEELRPQFADLPNLRRAATNAGKGDDQEAAAATAAAVTAAEQAEKRCAELLAEAQQAAADARDKQRAADLLK